MRSTVNRFLGFLPAAGVFLLLTGALALRGQPMSFGQVRDFKVPDFYEPPNQNQLKSLLMGREAVPLTGGLFLLKGIKLESYRLDGTCEFRILAPEAIFDSARREARSDGDLHVESGDGAVALDGRGFVWRQTNSVLIISNSVRTTIQPPPQNVKTNR